MYLPMRASTLGQASKDGQCFDGKRSWGLIKLQRNDCNTPCTISAAVLFCLPLVLAVQCQFSHYVHLSLPMMTTMLRTCAPYKGMMNTHAHNHTHVHIQSSCIA